MKISLRKRKIANGRITLFLEYYLGYLIDKNGKMKHHRSFEYLKLYLHENPITANEKKYNKETMQLAQNILTIKKSDYIKGKFSIKDDKKGKILFLTYYNKLKEDRYESKGNYDNWEAAFKHLERYCPANLMIKDVNEDFLKGFKKYLHTEAKTTGNTPLSQNTKYTYFNKIRAALTEAFNQGYLDTNIVRMVKGFDQGESKREYLTYSELQALSKASCKHPVLKNAFIFSCLTGLRWSDINKLIWSEVRDEEEQPRVIFRQKKTDGLEYLYISDQARALLGKRENQNDRVFTGLKYGAHFNSEILRWCMRAGITKHITFHSARHTNAVLLLENGADIYTVSKRLGHKEIRTTEIYAKIIDTKMKEAANSIPVLKFS
ncbi:tyrosine-type recombinase/integrase [Aureibaculum luteum]|uniref:tyrosine-type recombinase/integrase n=1 Tax=Aureibaculum luteum TaxID=1548456 RepID=UPI000E517509|nr:site-specific integrase [Aureibaculum luteum]